MQDVRCYTVLRASAASSLVADWDDSTWTNLDCLSVDQFHSASSDFRPVTRVRMRYDDEALHVLFRVDDQYVRSVFTSYQDMVSRDSCVEVFLKPCQASGYFNFEFNCGGAMLLYYIEDPVRIGAEFRRYTKVLPEHGRLVRVISTMPSTTPVEIVRPILWQLAVRIPWTVFEPYVGKITPERGTVWRGNLFKCAAANSHPHWASWSEIGRMLNFHQPDRFGIFTFG